MVDSYTTSAENVKPRPGMLDSDTKAEFCTTTATAAGLL